MSVTPLLMSDHRIQYVSFTNPVFIGNIKILVGRPEKKQSFFNLFSAFEIEVWATFISVFLLVAMLKVFQRQVVPNPATKYLEKRFWPRLIQDIFFTFAALINQGEFSYIPRLQSGRIMAGIWAYSSVLVMNFYSAKMTSVMAVQKIVPFIEKIEDIQNHPEVQPILHRGSNEVDYFRNSKGGPEAEVWRRVKEQFLLDDTKLYDDTRLDLIEAGMAGVFQEWRVFKISLAERYKRRGMCRFYATEPYRIVPVSLAFKPDVNLEFLERVNMAVSRFLAGNLVDFIYPPLTESVFQRCITNEDNSGGWRPLSFSDIYAVFKMYYICVIGCISTVMLELLIYLKFSKKKFKDNSVVCFMYKSERVMTNAIIILYKSVRIRY